MKFIEQHPNYKSYEHQIYSMSSTPSYGFINDLNSLVHAILMKNNEDDINFAAWSLQNKLAAEARTTPCEQTSYTFLLEEITRVFRRLIEKGFPFLMDGLALLIIETNEEEEVNEFLETHEIGYTASFWNYEIEWGFREGTEDLAESLVAALEVIGRDYQSTREHMSQAILQLQNAENSRSRKDALRDALSAIEAYVNSISGSTSFHKSFNTLSEHISVPPAFISDAQDLWSKIHKFHPDIRHGNEDTSILELPDALYYIDRLMAYVKYIHRKST